MSRWLKAVPLILALAALSIFAAGCGSGSQSQIRFVHAIADVGAMDINITGPTQITPTPLYTDLLFLGVQPNQPGYTSVPSGVDTIEGFLTGTTDVAFNSTTLDLVGDQQYTVVATGTVDNGQNAVLLPVTDDIPAPPSTEVAFRVIHASPSGPGTVDIYIQLNPTTGPAGSPTIPSVAYTSASGYVGLINNPDNDTNPPGFTVYVTNSGSTVPIFSEQINPLGGAVRTLILTDAQNEKSMRPAFLEISDLN